jgi:hypothetical protein
MSKFDKTLAQGKIYEHKAVKLFDYDTVEMKEGYFKEYDFSYTKDDKKYYVEVKSDRLSSRTGNLCIEYAYNLKASGITATTADYWVYYSLFPKTTLLSEIVKEEIYKIPVKELKPLLKGCRDVRGGDGRRSAMFLLPKKKVKQYLVNEDGSSFKCRMDETLDDLVASMCI